MSNKLKEVVIVSAIRTPIGTYKGSLKNIKSDQLGSIVIKEALKKSEFTGDEIDEVIMGQVLTAGAGQNPARQAAVNAGIPISKPAHIVNQVCGSGLRAVISGYQSIKLGESKNVISGGQESMSLAPHAIHLRDGKKLGDTDLIDTMIGVEYESCCYALKIVAREYWTGVKKDNAFFSAGQYDVLKKGNYCVCWNNYVVTI